MTDALLPLKATYEDDGVSHRFHFDSGFDLSPFTLPAKAVPQSAKEKFVGGYPPQGVKVDEKYDVVEMASWEAARFCHEMQTSMVKYVRRQISRKMTISVEATESLI